MQHRAAGFVARDTANTAAVLGVFALADTASEVALAAGDAILRAANAAQAIAQHAAEILQRATRDFVLAAAVNLEAASALFEFDRAARQDTPVSGSRRSSRN